MRHMRMRKPCWPKSALTMAIPTRELLISAAFIAVARHVIQLDYEHTPPRPVSSIALLVFSLAASYVGVRVLVHDRAASNLDRSLVHWAPGH